MNINDLIPYENNPRINDQAVDAVAESIKEFGFKVPIIIDKNNVIVAGHTRLKAAKKLGLEEVPVIVADDLTDAKIRAFRLADNKVGELATWDFSKLEEELGGIDLDMTAFDFDLKELQKEFNKNHEIIEDEVPEVDDTKEPICQLGDIWKLGRHRLMCGDSTDKIDVAKLMDGEKADMVFTDPPYGVNVKGGKTKSNISGDLTQTAIPFAFEIAVEFATKPKARFYFCGGEGNIGLYAKLFERFLQQMPRHLIWVKNGFVMKQLGYHTQYEIIFYGFSIGGGGSEHWFGGRKMEDASDVWKIDRDASSLYEHPTQKPIELPTRAIKNSSPIGAIVYDAFGGSGSTLVACEQLDRDCYMMELDPKYCDVIIKRWETLTGKKAEKF